MSIFRQIGSALGFGRSRARVSDRFDPFDTTGVPTGALVVPSGPVTLELRRQLRGALQKQRPEPGMLRVDPLGPAVRVSAGPLHPDRWLAWARELITGGIAREVHLYWLSPLDDADALWTVDQKRLLLQEKAPCEGPDGAWTGPLAALARRLEAPWTRADLQPPRPARFEPLADREITVTPTGGLIAGSLPAETMREHATAIASRLGHPTRFAVVREAPALLQLRAEALSIEAWRDFARELSRTDGVTEVALYAMAQEPALEAIWIFRDGETIEHRRVEASTDVEWLALAEEEDATGQAQHIRLNWPMSHLARTLGFRERAELLAVIG